MSMIRVNNLTKRYRERVAVDDLSFELAPGEILGLLGPNGAGKSSTLRMMTGFLPMTSGQIQINGFDIFEHPLEVKKCLGYLPETPPLYPEMTVEGFLGFVAQLKGLRGKFMRADVHRVCELTQLESVRKRLIQNVSKGFRQRVGLAQALLNNPRVLILDEPTEGLDPRQRLEVLQLIRQLAVDHTVILSTHILSEVKAVCSRVLILHQGKKVADEPLSLLSPSHNSLDEMFIRLTAA